MSFTTNNRSTGRLRASLRRRAALTAAVSALGLYCAQAQAVSILFIGNSFTYGAGSDVQTYNPGSVTDLNGTGIGGVPALFKSFAVQAGLDYDVSLETQPGSNLDFHYDNRLGLISQAWDRVVMHGQSTLDFANPGDPTKITTYANLLAQEFVSHNPAVEVNLMATWSRADQTYLPTGHWYGQPISAMQADVQAGEVDDVVGEHGVRLRTFSRPFALSLSKPPLVHAGTSTGSVGTVLMNGPRIGRGGFDTSARTG